MAKLVRTKDLTVGKGTAAQKGDKLTVDIVGYLPRGENVLSEKGLEFVLGARRVIAGLEKGVEGMNVGGEREIHIPPHLAYGDKGTLTVPPKAALRLVVRLINVSKKAETDQKGQTPNQS